MASRRLLVFDDVARLAPRERSGALVLVAIAAVGLAFVTPQSAFHPFLIGAGAGFMAFGLFLYWRDVLPWARVLRVSQSARAALDASGGFAFITDKRGRVLARNARAEVHGAGPKGLEAVVSKFSADPKDRIFHTLMRLNVSDMVEDVLGTPTSGARLHVERVTRGQFLWTLLERKLDPELAVMTVKGGLVSLNPPASTLLGGGSRALADIVRDLPVRQGAIHHLQTADGTEFEARLLETQLSSETSEIAILAPVGFPRADGMMEASALAVPDLLSVLPVPMLKVSEAGLLLEVNSEARSILSIDGDTLPPLFELVEGMGRPITDWLSDAAQGRGLLKPEIVRAVIPGQELFLQITLGRTVENGRAVLVGILNDATELKTLEAQFVQSQKMQAIGQLAGGVAHDFNNLLTAISGHCDLLLLRHEPSDPEYADLIQISQNANRAASLVGQLLAFSRKQNLKPQALDLRDTMADLAHLLNRLIGERMQLDVTHAPGAQLIRADRRQLEQVIVNLVVNARDAMPEGGRIEVVTRSEHLADDLTRDRAKLPAGEYVVIEVKDTGCGIPQEALSKIFEPFFSTKNTGEGTGLGLSTAYGIVKQTGGFIFVESEVSVGTTFSLYFPATTKRAEPEVLPEKPVQAAQPMRRDASILLVEDEAPVRAFACRALRLRGYTVIEAEDAESALSILEDKALHIDLFVTDVIMPGKDGPTWVRQALRDRPDTSVVFMSGYAEEGRAEKQARVPNSVFLPKPFSLQQLTQLVQDQLG